MRKKETNFVAQTIIDFLKDTGHVYVPGVWIMRKNEE
jgi:hypothetical protein